MAVNSSLGNDVLHRPVISEDGLLLATVTADYHLRVLRLSDDGSMLEVASASLPKDLHQVIVRLSTFRWASNATFASHYELGEDSLPLLCLSDGIRLVVINPNQLAGSLNGPGTREAFNALIVADYHLGDQLGRSTFAEFALDSQHVLVLFEMGSRASILSLTKPQRDDVPGVKLNNERSISKSPDGRSLAVLLRSKSQDQVMILGLNNGTLQPEVTFTTETIDAQGLTWSPDGDPVLAVYDSAAYGVKVLFFSALGHPLKQLEVSSFIDLQGVSGVGVSNLRWSVMYEGTILAVADGERRVLSMTRLLLLVHGNVIDGSNSIVWQQTGCNTSSFVLQKGAFDAVVDSNAGGNVKMLEFNCHCDFLATVVADNQKAVWLWQPDHPEPHTIILFQDNVQQIMWHPKRPDILLVITKLKDPVVFVWYSETKAPLSCGIRLRDNGSTKFQGSWLGRSVQGRYPFMLTTTKTFEIGVLEESGGTMKFKSLLHGASIDDHMEPDIDDDDTEEISTPSKPSRVGGKKSSLQVMEGVTTHKVDPADVSRW